MRINKNILLGLLLIMCGCHTEDKSQNNSYTPLKRVEVMQIVIPSNALKRTVWICTSVWVYDSSLSSYFVLYDYQRDSVKFEDIKQITQKSLVRAIKKRDSLNNAFKIDSVFAKEVEFWNQNNNINPKE